MNRRQFIASSCTAAVSAMTGGLSVFANTPQTKGLAGSVLPRVFGENDPILVKIFLRGGCDALQLVAPVSDKNYVEARESGLRIAEKGAERGLILANPLSNLDFCLHPKAAALKELYDEKMLAIIHNVGLTNGTRSHFDAMDLIERGVLDKKSVEKIGRTLEEGWLSRLSKAANPKGVLANCAVGNGLPLSFAGNPNAVSMNQPKDFTMGRDPRFLGLLKNMYEKDPLMSATALKTIESLRFLEKKLPRKNGETIDYQPDRVAKYPEGDFANELSENLKSLAQLIKMDAGVQFATVDYGGWDTHENQMYIFPQLVEALSRGINAFYNDLRAYHSRLTIVVMSEFGRRLKSNKSGGTDHGHGGVMFVLGGGVKGGKMYGTWQGLATEQLDNRVDLAVSTDYRTVLAEIAAKRFKIGESNKVFPNFSTPNYLNFLN